MTDSYFPHPTRADISKAVARMQELVASGGPLADDARADVGLFLAALDRLFSADPHFVNRVQQAWWGVANGVA